MDNDIIAQQPHASAAFDAALGDFTARDLAKLGDVEDFENFSIADKGLAAFRRKHAFQRAFNFVQQLIDNRVIANFDAFALSQILGLAIGPNIKGNNRRARCFSLMDIAFGNTAGG